MKILCLLFVLFVSPAFAQGIGVPLPDLAITGPGPDSTTRYFTPEGDLIGESQTTVRRPYPRTLVPVDPRPVPHIPYNYNYRRDAR